jgi:hypothetical protein
MEFRRGGSKVVCDSCGVWWNGVDVVRCSFFGGPFRRVRDVDVKHDFAFIVSTSSVVFMTFIFNLFTRK